MQTAIAAVAATSAIPNLQIYDASRFPIVIGRTQAMQAGYAIQWREEMTALVEQGRPFVLIHDQRPAEETQEDRKQRALWLKQYKAPLGAVCRALIHIEPDPIRRAALKAQALLAVKAFGIPMAISATMSDALSLAARVLDETTLDASADAQAPGAAAR
ncbi:hypothetical protein [Cupriavidus basilensis]|uniref:Uncharacterized protein n=1 Tax=Cupriavidus basilensis TaxID=68895 RepID=A0A643FZV2_9BURK|nr:hypothetical protein [Cupriavidus basilensis]QOT77960.1 hypothetical protein F7R26_008065 [Cupriavidus basilensis]